MSLTSHFLLLSSLLAFTTACASERSENNDNDQVIQSIRAVMEVQQAAWNHGDIEAFMGGYDHAGTTTFVSGDEITRGWQTVLDRYKQRYNTPGQMGTLSFSELEIQPLSPSYALADGRWLLTRANDTPHGRFTLLFRQTSNGWRIVHDTTTSATP
jgi:ketosteroid isomerase-like protein